MKDELVPFLIKKSEFIINYYAVKAAIKILSPVAFMLYTYLISHSPDMFWYFNSIAISKHINLSPIQVKDAIKELIYKHYADIEDVEIADKQTPLITIYEFQKQDLQV